MAFIFYSLALYGGKNYQITDVKNEFSSREYVILKVITSLITIVLCIGFILLNDFGFEKSVVVLALTLHKIFEALADPVWAILQRRNCLFIAGKSQFLRSVTYIIVFTIVDVLTHSLMLASIALVFISLGFLIFYELPQMRKVEEIKLLGEPIRQYIEDAKKMVQKNFVVFVSVFVPVVISNIPRYFIERFAIGHQGPFGIIMLPASFMTMFAMFIVNPHLVVMSEMFNNREYKKLNALIRKIMSIMSIVGVICVLLAYFFGIPVLSILFGADLADYRLELTFLVFGGIFYQMVMFFVLLLTIMRKMVFQAAVYIAAMALEAVLGLYLVWKFSIEGAVATYTLINIALLIIFATSYVRSQKKLTRAETSLSKQ
jgi:O-antigen/teichoic acid export membrane protein